MPCQNTIQHHGASGSTEQTLRLTSASGSFTDGTALFRPNCTVGAESRRGSNQYCRIEHGRCIDCGRRFRRVVDWRTREDTGWLPVEDD